MAAGLVAAGLVAAGLVAAAAAGGAGLAGAAPLATMAEASSAAASSLSALMIASRRSACSLVRPWKPPLTPRLIRSRARASERVKASRTSSWNIFIMAKTSAIVSCCAAVVPANASSSSAPPFGGGFLSCKAGTMTPGATSLAVSSSIAPDERKLCSISALTTSWKATFPECCGTRRAKQSCIALFLGLPLTPSGLGTTCSRSGSLARGM